MADTSQQVRSPHNRVRGFSCWGEIIHRGFCVVFTLLLIIVFCVSLGFNNSSGAKAIPDNITNCTDTNVNTLDIKFLRNSVNIISAVFLALSTIAVAYHALIILLKALDAQILEQKWKLFYHLDVGLSQFFTHMFVALLCAINLMGYLWGPYIQLVDDQLAGDAKMAARGIIGSNWAIYGLSFCTYFTYFSYQSQAVTYGYWRCYSEKCNNQNSNELREKKPF